jgi:hypothetical protein
MERGEARAKRYGNAENRQPCDLCGGREAICDPYPDFAIKLEEISANGKARWPRIERSCGNNAAHFPWYYFNE